jgi:tetratricopeptide (TPR) repeat protein
MPVKNLKRLMILASVTALVGCTTTSTKHAAADYYRESSADIVNRAPASMSVPQDEATAPRIDGTHIRTQADYHFTLADTYALEGNSQRAIEEYKLTLVYDPESSLVRLRLAAEYVKQGLVSEAIEQAKLAAQSDQKNLDSYLLLGGLYSALRMYDDATAQYEKVLELDPENAEAPMFIGALLAEQKRFDEALAHFQALAKNPKSKNPHLAPYYVGRILVEAKKPGFFNKAELAFNQSLILKPAFVDAVLSLGSLYEENKKVDQAVELYESFQETYGPEMSVAESLSKIYISRNQFDRAYRQFEIIEATDPDDLNVKIKMAYILIEKKSYTEAILKLEDILSKAPYSDKVRFYLGAVYEEIKDFKGAIAHFQKITPASTYYSEAVVHTAYLYKLQDKFDKAVDTVKAGIEAQPDHAQFYALHASFLDDQRKYEEAQKLLTDAVKKFPEHAQLRFYLGSVEDRLGKTAESIAHMKQVLTLDAEHVQALNFLAYIYAEHGGDLENAEGMVRKALELQPNDGYIMDTLGWVLFKRGKNADAVRILEAAYRLLPTEAVIAEHLGDAYYKSQMPEKAKKMYLRAIETESNKDNVKKIRSKIVSVDKQIQKVGQAGNRMPASADHP